MMIKFINNTIHQQDNNIFLQIYKINFNFFYQFKKKYKLVF